LHLKNYNSNWKKLLGFRYLQENSENYISLIFAFFFLGGRWFSKTLNVNDLGPWKQIEPNVILVGDWESGQWKRWSLLTGRKECCHFQYVFINNALHWLFVEKTLLWLMSYMQIVGLLKSVRWWNFKDGGSDKKKIHLWMLVRQKLGIILDNKVVQKLKLENNVITKNGLLYWYSEMKKNIDFWLPKSPLKARFEHFLTKRHSATEFFHFFSLWVLTQKSCFLGPTMFKLPLLILN
jgi:hypothetical protein